MDIHNAEQRSKNMRAIKSSGTKPELFIDSEFFHGKDFDVKKKPTTNAEFWEK